MINYIKYELLLRTNDAARRARKDGFGKFAETLEQIADNLLEEAKNAEVAASSMARTNTRFDCVGDV